jgi:organic radical activating enzyme
MHKTCDFHRTGGFCNHACSGCDRRMAQRAETHARRETQALGRLMTQARTAR